MVCQQNYLTITVQVLGCQKFLKYNKIPYIFLNEDGNILCWYVCMYGESQATVAVKNICIGVCRVKFVKGSYVYINIWALFQTSFCLRSSYHTLTKFLLTNPLLTEHDFWHITWTQCINRAHIKKITKLFSNNTRDKCKENVD
jgi:hypothetical protein